MEWKPEYCHKGALGCYCAVGYPYDKMCPDCRDDRAPNDIYSKCVCPPVDRILDDTDTDTEEAKR